MQLRSQLTRGIAVVALLVTSVAGATTASAARSGRAAPRTARALATIPVLGVTPNANLVDDEAVTVTAPHGAELYMECPATFTVVDNCMVAGSHEPGHATDTVHVLGLVPDGSDSPLPIMVDCRTTSCVLVAVSFSVASDGSTVLAQVALAFDPSGALRPAPTITATPTTGLVDGQAIAVTVHPGSSDPATEPTVVYACTVPVTTFDQVLSDCDILASQELTGTSGPDATGTLHVSAYLETPTGPVDCRAPAATCALFTLDHIFQFGTLPLSFTAAGPVRPQLLTRFDPTATEPFSTTYDLVGFTPNDPYTVKLCNSGGACISTPIASGTLDANGLATFVDDGSTTPSDPAGVCAMGCSYTASDAHGLKATGGPEIGIVTGPPIGTGGFKTKFLRVRATPHKGLHDGDVVSLTGAGFDPGAALAAIQCNGDASVKGPSECDFGTDTFGKRAITADAHGKVSTTFTIHRSITVGSGKTLDCAKGNIDPDAFDAAVEADPSKAILKGTGYFSCAVILAQINDYSKSGGDVIAFAGATFKPLPWETTPVAYHPTTAPPAAPVAAEPTFTG